MIPRLAGIGEEVGYCINCGQGHVDGTRFCRFCGSQQPGEQLLARLRQEALYIQQMRFGQNQNFGYGNQRW